MKGLTTYALLKQCTPGDNNVPLGLLLCEWRQQCTSGSNSIRMAPTVYTWRQQYTHGANSIRMAPTVRMHLKITLGYELTTDA